MEKMKNKKLTCADCSGKNENENICFYKVKKSAEEKTVDAGDCK